MLTKRKRTIFSLEVFPPRDSVGLQTIYASMGRFKAVDPDYISVTYGAGGSGAVGTAEIASDLRRKFGVESVAHLTCVGLTREQAKERLSELKASGVTDVLALRGDRREGEDSPQDFTYATDLISYINSFGGFTVSAACYPEGHLESASYRQDIEVAKKKADLNVARFISQLFFDNADFYRLTEEFERENIRVPVQAGIMPITSAKQILRIIGLCGAKLPPKLSKLVGRFQDNPEAMFSAGINYALEQITELIAGGVYGIHLYSMNNPLVAERIAAGIAPMLAEVNREG